MNTRSNRNQKNNTNTFAQKGRTFVLTAVVVAALNSVTHAQTNSSSGINRRSAQQAAQSSATTPKTTATPATRVKAAVKQTPRTSRVSKASKTTTPRAVKITIRGNRNDVRQARQQGIQSLQNANAALAAREAQRAADAEATANAAINNQALANANNDFQQPGNTAGYGFVPGFGYGNFGNPIASYGYGNSLYGSVSTTQPVLNGATPYGAPNQTFPSYYSNFGPGVYSTFSNFGPFGF